MHEKILESQVNPEMWKEEVNRIGKELEKKGEDVEQNNFDVLLRNYSKIADLRAGLKDPKIVKIVDRLEDEMDSIRRGEERMNVICGGLIDQLKEIVENKRVICERLKELSDVMQKKIDVFDTLNKKYQSVTEDLAGKEEDLFGNIKLQKVRQGNTLLQVTRLLFSLVLLLF